MESHRPRLMLIDFVNVAFGCWYSRPIRNSQGMNINAIISFFEKLRILKESFEPNYIVFASDLSRKTTFRRQMYPQYKAQRKEVDPDISNQLRIISSLVSMLGFKMHTHPLYEADDIIGMMSAWADEYGFETIIISSDRDLYQLITPTTVIYSPKKNEVIDEDFMIKNYNLTPAQWVELKILQGDNADNIPGIRGIGEKTALQLMRRYATISNIYDHLDQLPNKMAEYLKQGSKDINIMRELVTIIRDYTKIGMKESFIYRSPVMGDEIKNTILSNELDKIWPALLYSLYPQATDCLEGYHHDEGSNN